MTAGKVPIIAAVACLSIFFGSIPAAAEERSVLGWNFPTTTGICYESESQDNRSWLVSGLIFTDRSLSNRDISASFSVGRRFYGGSEAGRVFWGVYGLGSYTYLEPDDGRGLLGAMGTLGYEWRFGSDKNLRLFVEGGLALTHESPGGFVAGPAVQAGFGVNI